MVPASIPRQAARGAWTAGHPRAARDGLPPGQDRVLDLAQRAGATNLTIA